ncbi:MAG TPA: S-layer homology domain-containing protein [Thermoanaerobaculia bacterium]|nr:S-layer homology domain-containing protein [Thermoanaerobaculia bacterium]
MSPVGLIGGTSNTLFTAGITSVLPAGALLTYFELDYCDTNSAGSVVHGWLTICRYDGTSCNYYQNTVSSNGAGCTASGFDISGLNLTVDNYNNSYALQASTDAADGTNVINGVILGYQRQVSNYAGAPDFADVPASNPQYQFIEALFHAGITAGCGGGNYCPGNPLTRGQMAVYLAKALGLYFQN